MTDTPQPQNLVTMKILGRAEHPTLPILYIVYTLHGLEQTKVTAVVGN